MNNLTKAILAILAATIWISVSEFIRNEFLFKSYWVEHYQSMGLVFPSEMINGMVWGIWSLMFAIAIYFISCRFNLLQTFLISWLVGFVLMWLVLGNMGVLPFGILGFAVPLSLLESFISAWIIRRISKPVVSHSAG